MQFHADHLRFLRKCRASFDAAEEIAGGAPASWIEDVSPKMAADLPSHRFKRTDLLELIRTEKRIEVVTAAILGWGGMQRHHGRKLFEQDAWLEIASAIHRGEHSRADAYDAFASLRANGGLPGMGPAYFTKLIFFLMPRTNPSRPVGYIMDQWTACSFNLLVGDPAAVMTDATLGWAGPEQPSAQYLVSDHNSGERYERFCRAIEELAVDLDLSPDETELLLLSEGGRSPYPWREYVKKHRRPALNGLAA